MKKSMKITVNNIEDVFRAKRASVSTMEAKGYTLIEEFFVDNSGFGREDEPALLPGPFLGKVKEAVEKNGTLTAKLTNVGQFQVYVGLFKKTGESKAEKIGNNTYRIERENGYSIRLHDTDILIFENGIVTLDSGGWETLTTKSRMNEYLPRPYRIEQKNFSWYLVNGDTRVPFVDGMKITL